MATKELVSTTTVGAGGASSISFTSIPQTATDLLLLYSIRGVSSNGDNITLAFNGSTTGFSGQEIEGYGGGVGTQVRNSSWGGYANGTASSNVFDNGQLYIPNYTSSVAKTHYIDVVTEANSAGANMYVSARSWSGTAAINSITFSGMTFPQYSSVSLYIITKGSGGATVS